jgi:hypothetical protein
LNGKQSANHNQEWNEGIESSMIIILISASVFGQRDASPHAQTRKHLEILEGVHA